MRVLDVGCGVGGPAREIARFSDAKIVGLNNNEFQIGRARRYTKAAGLEDQVQFVKGDFMKLSEQFGDKPGGVVSTGLGHVGKRGCSFIPQFGVYEWCMTDSWDPSIPEHKALAHEIELGNGIPEVRHLSKARAAIKSAGFHLEHEEDLAERHDVVPWYYPLEGDVFKAQTASDYFTVWRSVADELVRQTCYP
jgi:sterol 24-C-methyltransferase